MKKFIKTNKTTILTIIGILLAVTITVTFSYFILETNGIIKTNISAESGDVDTLIFEIIEEAEPLKMTQFNFGIDDTDLESSSVATVTLSNKSGADLATDDYDLYFEINENTFTYSDDVNNAAELILNIVGPEGEITVIDGLTYVTSDSGVSGFDVTEVTTDILVAENFPIEATDETVHTWTVTLTLVNLSVLQTNNLNSVFNCNLAIAEEMPAPNLTETILLNNAYNITTTDVEEAKTSIENRETPDFDDIATTDEGMFATEDDYGTSYYFRGDVDDNWVYWAGFYWRIVRIDGQGNVKLIYSGTEAGATGDDVEIDTSEAFNSSYDSPEYVGYMYTLGELHGTDNDSTVKKVVDTWYTNNLADYESDIATDGIFCSDRTAYSNSSNSTEISTSNFTGSETYISYGAGKRIYSLKSPSLICTNELDKLTWEDSSEGNAVLANPIALITLDEASFAGGEYYSSDGSSNNSSYYLYTSSYYWTLSPDSFSNGRSYIGFIHSSGYLNYYYVYYTSYGVRITVYLDSESLATGDGSASNPYIIS